MFIRKTDAKAEVPVLWLPDAKSWLIKKESDAGKDWRQEEKGMTEDEMVGWHHWLDGQELEQVGDGQGSLACWNPWVRKESDTTERLNWKYIENSNRVWCKFPELFCRCAPPSPHPMEELMENYEHTVPGLQEHKDYAHPWDTILLPHHQPSRELCKGWSGTLQCPLTCLLKVLCRSPSGSWGLFSPWATLSLCMALQ